MEKSAQRVLLRAYDAIKEDNNMIPQLGGVEGVLGTVDHHKSLAVAYYDYKKAYDKVHHDWTLKSIQLDGHTCECYLVVAGADEKDQTRDIE